MLWLLRCYYQSLVWCQARFNKRYGASFMLCLKVNKFMVWPIRLVFIAFAIAIFDTIVSKVSQGYVISSGNTKYVAGSIVYYTTLMKFLVFALLFIFLAFRTVDKNTKSDDVT